MDKVEKFNYITEEMVDLYRRKNADYGDAFAKSYEEYGLTMSCIRINDKLNRLKTLSRSDAMVVDESIRDTLLDLASYAVMTVIEMESANDKG